MLVACKLHKDPIKHYKRRPSIKCSPDIARQVALQMTLRPFYVGFGFHSSALMGGVSRAAFVISGSPVSPSTLVVTTLLMTSLAEPKSAFSPLI